MGVVLPQTASATQLMQACAANGMQDLDHSALVCALELMANTRLHQLDASRPATLLSRPGCTYDNTKMVWVTPALRSAATASTLKRGAPVINTPCGPWGRHFFSGRLHLRKCKVGLDAQERHAFGVGHRFPGDVPAGGADGNFLVKHRQLGHVQ